MKNKILLLLLVSLLLFSCGAVKRSIQEKAAGVLEEQAAEMGLELDIDTDNLEGGLIEGLASEAVGTALEEAFLEEFADSMGEMDGAFERDADGNIIGLHMEGEGTEINTDGSTPWPSEIPSKIPEYTDGMIFSSQIEEGEMITLYLYDTTQDQAKAYVDGSMKPLFDTVIEQYDEETWVYVGASDSDGVVIAYDDEGLAFQYYMNADFVSQWGM